MCALCMYTLLCVPYICIMYVNIHYRVCLTCVLVYIIGTQTLYAYIFPSSCTQGSVKSAPVVQWFISQGRPAATEHATHRQHTFPESYARDETQSKRLCSPTLVWKVGASWVRKRGSELSPTRGRKKRRLAPLPAFTGKHCVWGGVCSEQSQPARSCVRAPWIRLAVVFCTITSPEWNHLGYG